MRIFILLLFFVSDLSAQAINATYEESSDPKALKLLKKLGEQYKASGGHHIYFSLNVEYPGDTPQTGEGQFFQFGEKFSLDLEDQLVVSDNESVWVYLKKRNEVQINDAEFEEGEDFLTPNQLYDIYKSDAFVFIMTHQQIENGIDVAHIEAKPLDRDSEYAKIKFAIDAGNNKLLTARIFYKDGSRVQMEINKHLSNVEFESSDFIFNPDDYNDIIIEDLRF